MTIATVFAGLLALVVGVTLGVLGGGGSVLTVPIFVYVLGVSAKSAVAMSMPVIGLTSAIGAIGHWRAGNVSWRPALTFGLMAMIGAFAGARLARFLTGPQQLVLLAVVMIGSAVSMLRPARAAAESTTPDASATPAAPTSGGVFFLVSALAVGVLTGLVGIGGGFLVVPALVLFAKMPIRKAIGTSLAVIALNALSGVAGYLGQASIDWVIVSWFTAIASLGMIIGTRLSPRLPASALRRGFALLLLLLALFMIWQHLTSP